MSKKIFLYNEFRSQQLTMDVIEAVEEYAPWFLQDWRIYGSLPKTLIYRGKKGKWSNDDSKYNSQNKIQLTNPKDNPRRLGSPIWHNLIIDNTEEWSEYPKRKYSLICTTNKSDAEAYGTAYVVIPIKEEAKFGVCDNHDIWYSFDGLLNEFNGIFQKDYDDLTEFEMYCSDMLKLDFYEPIQSIEELKKAADVDLIWKVDYIKDNYGTFYNFLIKNMEPEFNNFKLIQYDFDTEISKFNEVWTDSKCLLIESSLFNQTFGR